VFKPLARIYDPALAAKAGIPLTCASLPENGMCVGDLKSSVERLDLNTPCSGVMNNLGFVWFREERAYTQAMAEREVPVVLEHLVRELTFINIGPRARILAVARALHVRTLGFCGVWLFRVRCDAWSRPRESQC
jgi:hypothetical protein